MPTMLWMPLITAGVMMGAHRLLMRGETKDARTPLWKWSIVIGAGLFATFLLGSLAHGRLPFLTCVVIAVLGSAVLGAASWLVQRRLEEAQGGWRN